MKVIAKRVARVGAVVLVVLMMGGAVLAQGAPISGSAVVSLDPRASTVNVGSNVQADVVVNLTGVTGKDPSNAATPAVLGSYIIDLTFDAAKLQFVSVGGGSTPEFVGSPTANVSQAASGTVRITSVQNSPSSPTGKIFVAVATFRGLVAGSASLAATASSLATAYQPPASGPVAIPSTSQSKSVTVQVPVSNSPPVLTNPGPKSNAEGATISLQLSASDPNGDSLTYSATSLPPSLSISPSGLISGTLSFTSAGVHNVTASVSDGKGGSDAEAFTWTVTNTNRNPVVTNPGAQSSVAGATASIQISASDPDGDPITYSATGLPPGLSILPSSGLISGTLSANANGGSPYTVNVSAADTNGGSQAVNFSWTVSPASCPSVGAPVLSAPSIALSGETFAMTWTAVAGANEYQLQRSTSAGFESSTSTVRPGGSTSYQTSETVATDRAFYFRIRAHVVSGTCDTYGAFSAPQSVLVRATASTNPPGAPSEPSPSNGAVSVTLPVTLSWAPGADATSYEVRFGTVSPPPFIDTTSNTVYAVSVLPNTTYYWSVRAKNSAGTADGPVWMFTTAGDQCVAPPVPNASVQAEVEAATVYALSWTQSPGASEYIIEKASVADFSDATTITAGASESSRMFVASEPPGSRVYFRVKARVSSEGCAAGSDYSSVVSTLIVANATVGEWRIVPVVTSGPGAFGSFFRTTMQLHNRGLEPSSGKIVFHPQGVSAAGTDPFLTYSLEPGETKHIFDVVAALGREGAGSLDLIPLTGVIPRAVVRVFNDAGVAGTTGTNESLFSPSQALQPGDRAILITPPDGTRERFNVGVRTLAAGVEIAVTVLQANGARAASVPRNYPADYFVQTGAEAFAGVKLSDNSAIEIEILSGSAFIYGSATDNITQDPSMQVLLRD